MLSPPMHDPPEPPSSPPASEDDPLAALASAGRTATPRRRAAAPARRRRDPTHAEGGAIAFARFTLPICLVLGGLLLVLGLAWFLLPNTSPYKVGQTTTGLALLAAGIGGLLAGVVLMADVARRVRTSLPR